MTARQAAPGQNRVEHSRDVTVVFTERRGRGGTLVSTLGQPPQELAAKCDARAVGYQAQPNAEQLEEIADLIDSRRVRPIVAQTFPFADVQKAEEYLAKSHARGKVVVVMATD